VASRAHASVTEPRRFDMMTPMSEMRTMDASEADMGVPTERLCRVLELAVADSPLEETLGELIRVVEATSRTGVLGSILLLDPDGRHLRHGAAPSLPKPYIDAIDGAEIGPCAGSCGTAAFRGKPVFVSDIATDPLWAEYKAVALPHGLRACWSTPIITSGPKVLGTFAMYHREPREATVRDLVLVDLVTQTAALVIDRKRAQEALAA
jgi:GAF domain-containing protein